MSEYNYRIGYIDEDQNAINLCRRKLRNHDIEVVNYEVGADTSLDDLIEEILKSDVDLLLIDFLLETNDFNGDSIEHRLDEISPLFPRMIFTNNNNDAENYIQDWERIQSKDRLQSDNVERFCDFLKKKIDSSRSKIDERKAKLKELLEKGEDDGLSPQEMSALEKTKHYLLDSSLNPDAIGKQDLLKKENIEQLRQAKRQAEEFIKQLMQGGNDSH